MKIRFNDDDFFYSIKGYTKKSHVLTIRGLESEFVNLSGFSIYKDDEETIVESFSDYTNFYSTKTPLDYRISYTDIEGKEEDESQVINSENPELLLEEEQQTLTNQELTECIAELMYETSLMQLGMEV